MIASRQQSKSFFRDLQRQDVDFDSERFLTEVEAQFNSAELVEELHWRLAVLHELAEQKELTEEFEGLRDRLTRIFAMGGTEEELVAQVRSVSAIETKEGRRVDLRHFLVPERRLYNEPEYRKILEMKVVNTEAHAYTLAASYPDQTTDLRHLIKLMEGLAAKVRNSSIRVRQLKAIEDNIRSMAPFRTYENLKERFLRDWLERFAGVTAEQIAKLGSAEVQRLIVEHQRRQTTQLVKAGVKLLDADVSEHLGIHDTLEGEFHEEDFWRNANVAVKRGFNEWVLRVVQATGLVDGKRYAFFQSQADPESYLLVGLALPRLPQPGDEPIRMVPYLKPFTRKAGYLLEVRNRTVGDRELYFEQLLHYTLPFMFGFDRMPQLSVPKELRTFFNSGR